jgi:hypothetical protein
MIAENPFVVAGLRRRSLYELGETKPLLRQATALDATEGASVTP